MDELVALRLEFGVGAREALTEIPSWEYDLLVAAAAARLEAREVQREE